MNYLYNGVELPDINEVRPDKEDRPHVCIFEYDNSIRLAFCKSVRIHKDEGALNLDTPYTHFKLENGAWVLGDNWDYAGGSWYVSPGTAIWTNIDITENGTVLLAASDPIPVSSFTPDPISMTMGWLVGRWIAEQLGKHVEPDVPDVPEYIAQLENGALYIEKAPATLNGNILEVW